VNGDSYIDICGLFVGRAVDVDMAAEVPNPTGSVWVEVIVIGIF
jgi:hypothetical protein